MARKDICSLWQRGVQHETKLLCWVVSSLSLWVWQKTRQNPCSEHCREHFCIGGEGTLTGWYGQRLTRLLARQHSLGVQMVKNLPAVEVLGLIPGLGRPPWRWKWQSQVILPGESHGQRSLAGYSPWGWKELDRSEWLSTQWTWVWANSREEWRAREPAALAAVHMVAKSWTWLSNWTIATPS